MCRVITDVLSCMFLLTLRSIWKIGEDGEVLRFVTFSADRYSGAR
jgi:hypothetical protein